MFFQSNTVAFPATISLNFKKVIEILHEQANDENSPFTQSAKGMVADSNKYPFLKKDISQRQLLKYKDIIHKISSYILPGPTNDKEMACLAAPSMFEPFYFSDELHNRLTIPETGFGTAFKEYTDDELYINGCCTILEKYFHYRINRDFSKLIIFKDNNTGLNRTYRLSVNHAYMEIQETENSQEILQEDFKKLLQNFDDIELWKDKFPPGSWIMSGISILNMVDITSEHSLSAIASHLLVNTPESLDRLIQTVSEFFEKKDLQTGLMSFALDGFLEQHKSGMESLLLNNNKKLSCAQVFHYTAYLTLIKQKKVLIIPDVKYFDRENKNDLTRKLLKKNINSYLLAPICRDNEILAFLELGSDTPNKLTGADLKKIDKLMPILGMAISRFKYEENNRIEAIIQQECTTIHPAVKWRFEEEAYRFMEARDNNDEAVFQDIVFNNVYPIYGQLDIKSSSEKRNEAVKADLGKQLKLALKILEKAFKQNSILIYEELIFRLHGLQTELEFDLQTSNEQIILHFMQNEIHPVFYQLKKKETGLAADISSYFDKLHPDLHSIYEVRKKYDQHVNKTNQVLAKLLDEREIEAQQMFPHYFERYKTDGIEYNIYIGQSISNKLEFDPVYVHNLQLWQLRVTCELEQKFRDLKTELKTDIEIASLLLVYNAPISIHFRMDEKRFDVQGAYNARYEVIKKRIDKSFIKGSQERITSPGKIAIFYSNDQDASLYSRYISFLENKGYLEKNSTEYLEMEDMPGISGLKALRVSIHYISSDTEKRAFNIDEILDSLKNQS